MAEDLRDYLIVKTDGEEMVVSVPATWKVTFGPAVVGVGKVSSQYQGKMPMALRFYENQDRQRAIFTNVASFRDMSIPIKVKRVDTQEKQGFTEVDGKRKATTFQAKVETWVDPYEKMKDEQNLIPEPVWEDV
jgi:hypothetical protein